MPQLQSLLLRGFGFWFWVLGFGFWVLGFGVWDEGLVLRVQVLGTSGESVARKSTASAASNNLRVHRAEVGGSVNDNNPQIVGNIACDVLGSSKFHASPSNSL